MLDVYQCRTCGAIGPHDCPNVAAPSDNNGGSTDYYKLDKTWKDLQDVIEARELNYAQANILKVAFTFNTGRHSGTDELRDINKVIWFAERIKKQLEGK